MSPPSTAPGRPETLTKEEEAKLKELWNAVLKVFGVSAPTTNTSSGSTASDDDRGETSGPPDSKKKKPSSSSLGRLLSRKDKPGPAKKEAEEAVVLDVSDDKYGQTQEYKAALATHTPAQLREAFWGLVKCDNPDGLLLRFLRARKWDVDKALVMMVATINWRSKEANVQALIEKGEQGAVAEGDNDFMLQLRLGKSYVHGLDKDGRPICFVKARLHKPGDQSEESLERSIVYIMETTRLMLQPPVDTAAVVFDMTGFALANVDLAPVKYMIKCFEAHYPESLGICLVHKAPWIFFRIWTLIKGWLDPVVASKIHFTKTTEEMEQFIPRENIPIELGGTEDWTYTYIEPLPNENAALSDTDQRQSLQATRDEQIQEYEALTRAWIAGADAGVKEKRKELARRLSQGYWEMDKSLRARTIYDRTGVLGQNGIVDFYPQRKNGVSGETLGDDDVD